MADDSRTTSKGKPPPHIESYLTAKHSCPSVKIRPRKYYCVLYGNLLQCFNNEKSYTEKRENVRAQIDLDLVRTVTETICLPTTRQKQEYCFKLVFYNDNELDFIAQSKKDVREWVECLQQTKDFWKSWEQNEQLQIANKNKQNSIEAKRDVGLEVPEDERDPSLIKVSIIMSHGLPYTASVPPDGTIDDLWTAVLKSLPGHFCFTCITCQLRGSTMELWSVTKDGVAYKIEKHFNVAEYCSTAASPIYLLEHNFKLLVVFFEDSTFLVSPAAISTKAREIPNIELFSRKLSEIECSNAQLYLKTSSGTVTPFSLEDEPLRTLWELHGDQWALKCREGGKFILKSRVILRNNPENLAERFQEGKLRMIFRERKQKEVLDRIEIHGCKSKMKKILQPLVPAPEAALPFEPSLTSSPDMKEDYFSCEPVVKTKYPIKPCTFVSSPVNTTPGQLNAPFCPPDNLDFEFMACKPSEEMNEEVVTTRQRSVTHSLNFSNASNEKTRDAHVVPLRRQRSVTDVTPHRTGSNNKVYYPSVTGVTQRGPGSKHEIYNSSVTGVTQNGTGSNNEMYNSSVTGVTQNGTGSTKDVNKGFLRDAASLTRKGAFRRKPSQEEATNTNMNQSRNSSCDTGPERVTPEKTADIVSQQAQSVPEVTSSEGVDDERTRIEKQEILDQENKVTEIFGSTSNRQDGVGLGERNANVVSDIVNEEREEQEVEIEQEFHNDTFDSSIQNNVGQSEFKDNVKERHSCDYYDVKTPYFLKDILDQYSRLSAGEIEIGVQHPPQTICLSSYHLTHVEGRWELDVENDVELDEESNEEVELKNCDVFALPGGIKVLFNRSKRTWTLKRIKLDQQLEDAATQNEVFEPSRNQSRDQLLTNEDAPREKPANESPSSMEEREDFRSTTWKSGYHPLTINNCGQNFRPLDDSFELEDEEPTQEDFTEIRILEDIIQKLFYHMEKHRDLSAAECLDDRKYPEIRKLVCVELCSALHRVVSDGLKKRHTLWSAIKYSVWEVVKGTSTNNITGTIVKKIIAVGAIDDKTRFELFVCECLNQKAGALASWVEVLQNDQKKLRTYYEEQALVMKLPKDTLEKLVSRITFLPFNISFYQHVQKKMREASAVTQFAFE